VEWPLDSLRCLQFHPGVDHATIIERLGGYRYVAERVGRDPSTVCRWQTAGIPAEHWPAILRLAKRLGVRLSLATIEKTSPLWGDRTAAKPAA